MSTLHTPGPWTHRTMTMARKAWAALGRSEIQIVAKNGNVIAAVWCAEDRPGEKEANAVLIATAPDLLDGCNALLGLLQLICARDDIDEAIYHAIKDSPRVEEARAAVAKATAAP